MTDILVRDVEPHVASILKERASRDGRSLMGYLRVQLADLAARAQLEMELGAIAVPRNAVMPTVPHALSDLNALRAQLPVSPDGSVDILRDIRDGF